LKVQVIVLVLGLAVTFAGLGGLILYWSGYSNNLGTLSTNINAGWSSNIISNARVELYIVPNWFGKDDNLLEIVLWGINTNTSAENVTFILLVPFYVNAIITPSNDGGVWSIRNVGSASVVCFKLTPISNDFSGPSLDFINTYADLRFTHLPALNNHGTYTATIPFGQGTTLDVLKSIEFITSEYPFPVDLNKNITFGFLLKSNLAFISSSPESAVQGFTIGLPYHYSNQSESLLSLNYHPTSALTITFQDSGEVNTSFSEQALGFLLLGVGIPIIVSSYVELIKMKKDEFPSIP
jgi:hypothetical protein